ncbi:MAG: hypothetical protein LBU80_01550 [Rikenellaceae bacterium]|jgi:hypothetical protein|nr:hypothetical protein [Rikenellaceae bacterium]
MKKILLILFVAVGVASCVKIDAGDVQIVEILKMDMAGASMSQARLNAVLEVSNDSRHTITVREADLVVSHPTGGELLYVTLDQAIVLPKRSTTEITVPITVKSAGPMGFMGLMSWVDKPETLSVSGDIRLQAGSLRRTFHVENMPLKQLLDEISAKTRGNSLPLPW